MGMAAGTDEAHDAEAVADRDTTYKVDQGTAVISMDAAGTPAPQQGQVCNSGWNLFIKESKRGY